MSTRRTPNELDELVRNTVSGTPHAVTAYELVSILADRRNPIAPPQAYRTLGRLVARGEVVRVETLNAYRPNLAVGEAWGPLVFCRRCRVSTRENCPGLEADLASLAESAGFEPVRFIVEVPGLCADCEAEASRP